MEADGAWSHVAEFAAVPTSAARARSWVRLRLLDHALPHLVQDLQLVVSELATNAMVHAATPFVVTLSGGGQESVLLEVLDGARAGPVKYAAQTLDTSGRGVAIVDALSLAWGVTHHSTGGKSVWAEFDHRE